MQLAYYSYSEVFAFALLKRSKYIVTDDCTRHDMAAYLKEME